jgi:hypothetical protein
LDRRLFFIIILISLSFSIILGSGLYGYSGDYHSTYFKNNLNWNEWHGDRLGWRISTFTIFNQHLGVYITSFFLAFSTGKLLSNFFIFNRNFSLFYFLILYLITIHTWPIIMSTSNAMRQGLTMSFFYLSLCALNEHKPKKSILFIILANFSHTAGNYFLIIYLMTLSIEFLFNKLKINKYAIIFLIILASAILYYYLKSSTYISFIIGNDFSKFFLLINISMIFYLSFFIEKVLKNYFSIVILINSFLAPAFFFNNLWWQYERINMMFVILMILVFGSFFKKNQNLFVCFLSLISLLLLTYYTGMYSSFRPLILN